MITRATDGSDTLCLEGEATINCAQALHDQLCAASAGASGPLRIEATRLEALDLVGAQILLAFRASRGAGGVRFEGWSAPITVFLTTSGLAPHFA